MATSTPIEIVQGATYSMAVTWTDGATPPTPKSLSGYWAHMQIRTKLGSPGTLLIDLSSLPTATDTTPIPPAITLEPDDQIGVVDIRISAELTAKLTKPAVYDLFLIKSDDPTEAVRLLSGSVTVDRSVTVNP